MVFRHSDALPGTETFRPAWRRSIVGRGNSDIIVAPQGISIFFQKSCAGPLVGIRYRRQHDDVRTHKVAFSQKQEL